MLAKKESATVVWLACIGIGLLFLARGAFQPYVFPIFEHLGGLSYAEIALLVNGYIMAQSVCAPLAGWYTDHTSVRTAIGTSMLFGLCSFLVVATSPGALAATLAVFFAGLAFVLGKIAFNTVLVQNSSAETLRRSVAKRATLLNLGSFIGNSLAVGMTTRVGYAAHAVLLGLLHLPLAIGFAVPASNVPRPVPASSGLRGMKALCNNRGFVADSLRRFAVVLPYGCWGTIIPKYVIDQYGSSEMVWVVYLTSVCTTVVGAHFLAVVLSAALYRRGFRWEWWSMVSVVLYCIGLLLLVWAGNVVVLPLAIAVFICGEVVMTPCFDETAKKHSSSSGMATCMGLLHLVDGFGRMLGAAFALAAYAWIGDMGRSPWYWPVVVGVFFVTSSVLYLIAAAVGGSRTATACPAPQATAERGDSLENE